MTDILQNAELFLSAAQSQDQLVAAYQMMAAQLGQILMTESRLALLYLQESRGPGIGARKPIRDLAERINSSAVHLTQVAREHGLLRDFDPRVSALAVVGAIERLLYSYLSGDNLGDPVEVSFSLISLILDGLRPVDG